MPVGNITICRADELLEKVAALKPAAVLSIEHPGYKLGEKGYAPRLANELPRSAAGGTPQMILTFWDTEQEDIPDGPDIEQVERGLAFVMEHITKGENVIIHCHAGKARSVAIALGVLSQLNPRDNEETLVKKLLALRPIAAPNIIIVRMVDELTGRGGKLVKAVLDDPQITAAREKANLGRDLWREQNPEKFPPLPPPKMKPNGLKPF